MIWLLKSNLEIWRGHLMSFVLLLFGVMSIPLTGCLNIPLDPLVRAMESPGMQATMRSYSARARVVNPELQVTAAVVYSIRAIGVEGDAELKGDREGGMDPELYRKFVELKTKMDEEKAKREVTPPPAEVPETTISFNLFTRWKAKALAMM